MDNRYRTGEAAFPPYGDMTDGLQQDLDKFVEIPPDFVPSCGDARPREAVWAAWKNDTFDILAKTLWPRWDPTISGWKNPDSARMFDLTLTDLGIIVKLKTNVLGIEFPDSPVRSKDCPVHETFYRSEDDADWFNTYHFYDTGAAPGLIDRFSKIFDLRGADKFGSVHLQVKAMFQRPRAFQTTFILDRPTIRPLRAISAGSPSLCSGHALQALLGVGAAMEFLFLQKVPFSSGSWTALRQFAVDIGDRRVFAGVHYPSDNLASWIVGMRLAGQIFRSPDVKAELWRAISMQSRVFTDILREPVYKEALDCLREAAADVQPAVDAAAARNRGDR